MTQVQAAVDSINWGVNVAFVVTVVFPMGIRPFWKWTESDWGWNTIVFDIVVALALLPAWLHHVLHIDPTSVGFLWVQAGSIWSIPVLVLWRAWIIFQVQRHADLEKTDASSRH